MHIAWVNERADFVGGAERYVARVAELLRARGHRNTLLYSVSGWTEPRFTQHFDGAFPLVDGERQLRELAPDVLFVHQLRGRTEVANLLRARVPSVRFFHDHALFCLREHKYRTLGHETCTRTVGLGCYPCLGFVAKNGGAVELRTVGSLLREQETNHGFDAFVVGSSYMRDHVVAHGFESSRVHANPLFVEPQDTGTGTRDPFQILFVGALLRGKGLDVLLEAMAKVRSSAHLLVVGTGAQEALFRELASELGLAARVTFAGQLDRPSLARAYAESACLVVPSRSPETFGLTGPEAMLHGTPVIASAVGGMGEWLVDGVTGLAFPSGDAEALAGAIHRVLDNPEDAARMVAEGRRRCEENFRADAHVDRLLTVLEGVVRS